MYTSKIFVTVDAVVFKEQSVLLIKRLKEPFQDCWALPGGFVDENEDLLHAVKRELFEETNIKANDFVQIGAFGTPGRDPRHHTVSVVFTTKVPTNTQAIASDDAKEAEWFAIDNLPELAFDHQEIIAFTLKKINNAI